MKTLSSPWFKRSGLFLLVVAGATLALQGCFRHNWNEPERFDRHAARVTEEVTEELELREDQLPAFNVLADKAKALAQERMDTWSDSADRARASLSTSPADMAPIAALLKERIRDNSIEEQLASLVDETLDFYNTLDAEQQAVVSEHLSDKLDHHGH